MVYRKLILSILSSKSTTPTSIFPFCLNSVRNMCENLTANATPSITRIDSPLFSNIFTEGVVQLKKLFEENNYEIRLCGGAVRDILLNKEPKDLDFATTATPDEMVAMFEAKNVRMFNQGGISHGTVSCRIEEENFEITTLRIDKVTDGRHAEVEFTKDWFIDASRRDLTFNSLFLTLDGDLIDYFQGQKDLESRRVRFVNDPFVRIQEDYLRILRYFRFFGRVAKDDTSHDKQTLQVIEYNRFGLKNISGERIWVEMTQIINGKHVTSILKTMQCCEIFDLIGFPSKPDIDEFEKVYNRISHLKPHHMTLVSALLQSESELVTLRDRVRLSNMENQIAMYILKHRDALSDSVDDMMPLYIDILVDSYKKDKKHAKNIFMELMKYTGDLKAIEFFEDYKIPVFPVNGNTMKKSSGLSGKAIGGALQKLFDKWKSSRYTLNEQELLEGVNADTNWDEFR